MLFNRHFLLRTVAPLAALGIAGTVFFDRFFIKHRPFRLRKNPQPTVALKIAHLSDLHLKSVHFGLRRLCQQLNQWQPDLLVFTGDSLDDPTKLNCLDELLGLLDAAVPKVAILGNWEYKRHVDVPQLRQVYARHNCQLLINESTSFVLQNKRVAVSGTDDLMQGTANYTKTLAGYKPADYHLLLTHCPQYYDVIRTKYTGTPPIDLVLAGHTHGGQITFWGFAPLLPLGTGRYVGGWYAAGPPLYVSRGIGCSTLPIRFGPRAEVALFTVDL
ncbi:metallophosphoesterase [Hymenobacter crusticola]|uniref:Calcineurin-like phosphoesterase domain-containing protein n=1 Tax=Hymenobacter crusticola TaxID=1770526 RepID=A0A243WBG0_9BACT|nr:metallophosphoesterase [Hymenobacter crusticola]OUJ71933.1 hypothetical protein BXP70_20120 [Hymenobacter crusticola]